MLLPPIRISLILIFHSGYILWSCRLREVLYIRPKLDITGQVDCLTVDQQSVSVRPEGLSLAPLTR